MKTVRLLLTIAVSWTLLSCNDTPYHPKLTLINNSSDTILYVNNLDVPSLGYVSQIVNPSYYRYFCYSVLLPQEEEQIPLSFLNSELKKNCDTTLFTIFFVDLETARNNSWNVIRDSSLYKKRFEGIINDNDTIISYP